MQKENNCTSSIEQVSGEVLVDEKNGNVIDWQGYKLKSEEMADIYERIGDKLGKVEAQTPYHKKSERVRKCAHTLVYRYYPELHEKCLYQAFFCKVRLCPMCTWRRSLKVFGQVSRVMDYMTENKDYKYLFLGLTAKNVHGSELSDEFDRFFKAFNLMTKLKAFKAVSKGWFRCLEVTRNWTMDEYHPHFHVIIAVNKSYFTDAKVYLEQKKWAKMWQNCLGIDYEPRVDIRTIKPDEIDDDGQPFAVQYKKAVAEVAKYTVKGEDVILRLDEKFREKYGNAAYEHFEKEAERLTDETVITLDAALKNRRLIAFGGALKEIHKMLEMDDPLDGDLVQIGDEIREDLQYILLRYRWSVGMSDYFLSRN